jgi:hypothetical protein
MTALDPVFLRARECSQFWLIWSLLGVRSLQDPGWDPYESTIGAIDALVKVHALADGTAQGHLQLIIYGHIVEASEPYELLANLVDIGQGGMFHSERFPPGKDGRPLSPATKIARLKDAAAGAGLLGAIDPLNEIWDRDLRNSVFHADYALYRGEVRIMHPTKVYRHENVLRLVNSALAYHHAMATLRRFHISSYTEPVLVPGDPRVTNGVEEDVMVIVRDGHGAIGLQNVWRGPEAVTGHVQWRVGRFYPDEVGLLSADPARGLLPGRPPTTSIPLERLPEPKP